MSEISTTRISKQYLQKLRKLSERQKRSMTKTLEFLIDNALEGSK